MNRRNFIQRCFAAVTGAYAAFVPGKASPDIVFAPRKPKECIDIYFKGYRFTGFRNEIMWKKIDGNGWRGGVKTKVQLPTFDRIRYFHHYQGQLFWVGEYETWEIQYIGGDLEFQYQLFNNWSNKTPKPCIERGRKIAINVCYCHKPGNHIACNYPKCKDYNPGNEKPYKDEYE